MYYPDLSKRYRQPKTLHVGWLDASRPFETARPPKWMVRKLWSYCECSVMHACGCHDCNLADCPGPGIKFRDDPRLTAREAQESHASFRTSILSGTLSGLSKDRKASMLSDLDQSLKDSLRGYSIMAVGVHPDTGERMRLGYAEIHVFGKRGKIYVAPNMIYHYVTVHHYQPPDEFVEALKARPSPPDPEYRERLFSGVHPAFVEFYQSLSKAQRVPGSGRRRKSVGCK